MTGKRVCHATVLPLIGNIGTIRRIQPGIFADSVFHASTSPEYTTGLKRQQHFALEFVLHFDLHIALHFDLHIALHFDLHFALHFDLHIALHFDLHFALVSRGQTFYTGNAR